MFEDILQGNPKSKAPVNSLWKPMPSKLRRPHRQPPRSSNRRRRRSSGSTSPCLVTRSSHKETTNIYLSVANPRFLDGITKIRPERVALVSHLKFDHRNSFTLVSTWHFVTLSCTRKLRNSNIHEAEAVTSL